MTKFKHVLKYTSTCIQITILLIYLLIFSTSRIACNRHNNNGESEQNILNGAGDSLLSSLNFNNFVDTINSNHNHNNVEHDQCLANYELNEGIIIRTKDSQANGAKYLNESDLGTSVKSKDECMRLCCQTLHCNVITYEEKNSGSCYMFDCGPLENFQCKFTEQEHYMSAILKKREQLVPVLSNKNNQHEAELNQLRNVENNNKGNILNNNSENPPSTLSASSSGIAGINHNHNSNLGEQHHDSPSRCSRWQFECKSTKECIAIYNACDGVVQCPDGSDEAVELHCPSVDLILKQQQKDAHSGSISSSSSSAVGTASGNAVVGDTSLLLSKGQPSSSRVEEFRLSQLQQQQQLLQPPNSRAGSSDKNYNNADNNNHIFNHKDSGVLDDAYGTQQQQQALQQQQRQLNPANSYWKSYDYNNAETLNPYGQPIRNPSNYGGSVNPNNNYLGAPFLPPYSTGGSYLNAKGQPQMLPNGPSPPLLQQPHQYNNNMQLSLEAQQQQLQTPYYNSNPLFNVVTPPTHQIMKAITPSTTSTTSSTTTTPTAPTTKISAVVAAKVDHSQDGKIIQENQLVQSLLQKTSFGVSHPNVEVAKDLMENVPGGGAIFAFILGIAMSIMMVLVIGCRFRHRKNGARRRGKNRLDPDYLVDGMYL